MEAELLGYFHSEIILWVFERLRMQEEGLSD